MYHFPMDCLFISNVDGSEQRYVRLLPADFDHNAPHHLIIALHGHGADRWQFISDPRDETRGVRDIAAAHRLIIVSPDYRATTSWMGPLAEADLLQIIDEVKEQFAILKVILVGGSMGGSAALTFTALHPTLIAGVCALNPLANHLEYDQFQEAIGASFGGHKTEIPGEYKKRSAEYWPDAFTMPVGITTGGRDTIVPPHSAIRFSTMLRNRRCKLLLLHREMGGHATDYADTIMAMEYVVSSALRDHEYE